MKKVNNVFHVFLMHTKLFLGLKIMESQECVYLELVIFVKNIQYIFVVTDKSVYPCLNSAYGL